MAPQGVLGCLCSCMTRMADAAMQYYARNLDAATGHREQHAQC